MLVDDVDITISGGKGGPGKVSFFGKLGGGPDGGDGGRGGDVYVEVTTDLYALTKFLANNKFSAGNGEHGGSNRRSGEGGKDLTLIVPIGTSIIDLEKATEVEMLQLNKKVLLAKGGLGGKGNDFFKSPSRTTPRFAQPGLAGEEKKLKLKLKLIADFGLIGLPNAGKSSLLNELTSANAKIGAYPFTTLEPNLGMLKGKVIADIPGLIEGASEGKGLGHQFLKHIEKVSLLLHCISGESADPLEDYKTIHSELAKYNPKLLEKPEVIILTKSDLLDEVELKRQVKSLKTTKKKLQAVSIHNWDSLQSLITLIQPE